MKKVYTAEATIDGRGRTGRARTSDGALDVDLSMPAEIGGDGGPGTNPEQLFAAAYGACFTSAIGASAKGTDVSLEGASMTCRVNILKGADGFSLAVELIASIPQATPEQAQELLELAHKRCPFSKATRGNIEVTLSVAEPSVAG